MYIYRSLRSNEFYNNMIFCKEYFSFMPLVELPKLNEHFGEDALDLVGTHITKGNTSITPWISCTKNYARVKNYLYGKGDYVYGLAVIKNHEKEQFNSPYLNSLLIKYKNNQITYEQLINSVRHMYLCNIRKCVLDFSTGKSKLFENFIESGCVNFRNGELRKFITKREHNYSHSNDEVLVLGEIPSQDIYILDPLKIDLFEYLKNKGIIDDFSDELLDYLVGTLKILHYFLAYDDVSTEEMLTEPLKSTYLAMHPILQQIFTDLYINKMKKETFTRKYNISGEYLKQLIEIIFEQIIDSSDYLKELTCQVGKKQQQIKLVNS